MQAHRITFLATALALVAVPAAFGADAPRGSHGQETDKRAAAKISIRCASLSTTALAAQSAAFAAPRGSHGQETDRPAASRITLRLACVNRSVAALAARPTTPKADAPKGSHGQETDRHAVQS
jgi:hypothetical protein